MLKDGKTQKVRRRVIESKENSMNKQPNETNKHKINKREKEL